MAKTRENMLPVGTTLSTSGSPFISDPFDIENWGQVAIETFPGTVTGGWFFAVEVCTDDMAWVALPIEDPSGSSGSGGDYVVPGYRYVRQPPDTAGQHLTYPITVAGYKKLRIKAWAGTSATACQIYLNRLRLSSQ